MKRTRPLSGDEQAAYFDAAQAPDFDESNWVGMLFSGDGGQTHTDYMNQQAREERERQAYRLELSRNNGMTRVPTGKNTCGKCGGTGKLEAFRHRDNGNCYRCGGRGWLP